MVLVSLAPVRPAFENSDAHTQTASKIGNVSVLSSSAERFTRNFFCPSSVLVDKNVLTRMFSPVAATPISDLLSLLRH